MKSKIVLVGFLLLLCELVFGQRERKFIRMYQNSLLVSKDTSNKVTRTTTELGQLYFVKGEVKAKDDRDSFVNYSIERGAPTTFIPCNIQSKVSCDTIINCFLADRVKLDIINQSFYSYILNGFLEYGLIKFKRKSVRLLREDSPKDKQDKILGFCSGSLFTLAKVEFIKDSVLFTLGYGESLTTKGFDLKYKSSYWLKQKDVDKLNKLFEHVELPPIDECIEDDYPWLLEYFDGINYHCFRFTDRCIFNWSRPKVLDSVGLLYGKMIELKSIYQKKVCTSK